MQLDPIVWLAEHRTAERAIFLAAICLGAALVLTGGARPLQRTFGWIFLAGYSWLEAGIERTRKPEATTPIVAACIFSAIALVWVVSTI